MGTWLESGCAPGLGKRQNGSRNPLARGRSIARFPTALATAAHEQPSGAVARAQAAVLGPGSGSPREIRTRVVGALPDGQSPVAAPLRHIAGTRWSTPRRSLDISPLRPEHRPIA